MNGNEFLKKLRKYGKVNGLDVTFITQRGKGSHGTVYVGGRRTTLKDRKKEIGEGLLNTMLEDLNINKRDL